MSNIYTTTTTVAPGRLRLLEERGPDSDLLAMIEAVEADPTACGLTLEQWAAWLRSLLPDRVHGYAPSYPADKPTSAAPGSEEKIQVMTERVRRGMSLHHPLDERSCPEPDECEFPVCYRFSEDSVCERHHPPHLD